MHIPESVQLYTLSPNRCPQSHFGNNRYDSGNITTFHWTSHYFVISLNHPPSVYERVRFGYTPAGATTFWGSSMGNFYTDVISRDARFNSMTRIADTSLLEPTTCQLVESIVSAAHQMGIELMIYETYRSQDRQQELFNQGATKLRTAGVHHFGLACDIVRVVGGEPCWKGDFSFLGHLAQSCGLIWAATGALPTSNITSSTACTCSVAQSPGKEIYSLATGIPAMRTIRTKTSKIDSPPQSSRQDQG